MSAKDAPIAKPLTFAQVKAFAAKIAENGFKGDLPPMQVMHEGVPYEPCAICSEGLDYKVCHPVGVPHEECV